METLTDSKITAFAALVRAELRDLPKSVVEELTGDLEAGLRERELDEGEDFKLGSARDYAAELREAAGVAPKPARGPLFSPKLLVTGIENWFRRNAFTEAILEFGISIRPLWWVARAFIAWMFVWGYRDYFLDATAWWLLVGMSFVSIMWGLKKWFNNKFFAALLLPLNLIAILLAPTTGLMIQERIEWGIGAQNTLMQWPATDGLRFNGESVTSIKAVDAVGKEVTGLKFLDANGVDLLNPAGPQHVIVVVPDLTGKTILEAQAILTPLGIQNVDINYLGVSNDHDAVVKSTMPAAGEQMDAASTLTLVVDVKK